MYRRKKWQRELRKHKKKEAGAVVYAAVPFLFILHCLYACLVQRFLYGFFGKIRGVRQDKDRCACRVRISAAPSHMLIKR